MLYANVMNGQIREERDFADPPPAMRRKGFKWLPVIDTKPAFDPVTQARSGPVVTIKATRVTRVWTVRALTADELDAAKDAVVGKVNALWLEVAFDQESRIRALEGKPAISKAEFRSAMRARLT